MKSLTNVILKNSKRNDQINGINKKEILLSTVAFMIVFIFLSVIMMIFSFIVTKKLEEINQTYAFVNILLLTNYFILFTKSVFESLNVLYFSRDLKILLRMPIKPISLIHAKILNMIISEYQMEIIMLAIPMMIYGLVTNVGLMFYLYMIIILLFLPIIPILITTLIISTIMRFTNVIKNKSKVMYLTIIFAILILGFVTMSFNTTENISVSGFENVILQANGLAETIADYFVLIKPIMSTLQNYNNMQGLQNLLIYLVENIICYVIVVFIVSKIYLKGAIGTIINSKKDFKGSTKLTIKDFKKKSIIKSYISKEIKVLKRSPIFFIQCLLMPIVDPLIVLTILLLFVGFASRVGVDVWGEFNIQASKSIGCAIFLAIGQAFYMMNFCSIIAVSKESKNAIQLKYLPLSLKKQFSLKISIGVLVNSLVSIFVAMCYYFCTYNIGGTIIIFINLILLNLIGEKFKLLIDLKNPQITWDSEYTMMKQNSNVMYELFYTLVVVGLLVLISNFINNVIIFLSITLIVLIIINTLINEYAS